MPKSNINLQNVQKIPPKSAKSQHYSLSWQKSVKFGKDFTRDRIFLHKHCSHVHTFLQLWSGIIGKISYTLFNKSTTELRKMKQKDENTENLRGNDEIGRNHNNLVLC